MMSKSCCVLFLVAFSTKSGNAGSCPDREIEGKCNKNIKAHGFTIQTEANFVCFSMFISSLHGLHHNSVCLIGVATLLAQHPPSKLQFGRVAGF